MLRIRQQRVAPTGTQDRARTEHIDRHRHDDHHQLVFVSSGVVAITTERGAWVASNDRALWIRAGIWHERRFYGTTRFHTIGVTVDSPLVDADEPVVVGIDPLARELIIALTDHRTTSRQAAALDVVLRDRIQLTTTRPITLPTPRDPRLAEACRTVEDDLRQQWSLGHLARRSGTSQRTLSRLFQAELAMTYPQWRTRTRIFAAMVLLAEGSTVTQTAHDCGWATTRAFIDTFSRAMSTTPSNYRRTPSR